MFSVRDVESKVRKIVAEAKKRNVWGNANKLIAELKNGVLTRFDSGCAINTEYLRIYTGVEFFALERTTNSASKNFAEVEIKRGNGEVLFRARMVEECRHKTPEQNPHERIEKMRHIRWQCLDLLCVVIDKYIPGQWEKILIPHEAKRLIDEERAVQAAIAKKKNSATTMARLRIARDLGIKP